MSDEPKRWQGADYDTSVREHGDGRVEWKVLRRDPGTDGFRPVPGAKGTAKTKAEAKYLAEHRREVVREGDAIH